jgi:hypothetical protein
MVSMSQVKRGTMCCRREHVGGNIALLLLTEIRQCEGAEQVEGLFGVGLGKSERFRWGLADGYDHPGRVSVGDKAISLELRSDRLWIALQVGQTRDCGLIGN